eukprot:2830287-Rhodomonas_salina.1
MCDFRSQSQLRASAVLPGNGTSPINISRTTHPTPHSSTSGVYALHPIKTSGARYQSEHNSRFTVRSSDTRLASPKSQILAWPPSLKMRMLAGLTSKWITPHAWM